MKTIIRAMVAMAMIGVAANSYPVTNTNSSSTLDVALTLTNVCTVVVSSAGATLTSPALSTGGVLTVASLGTVTVGDCGAAYKLGADKGGNYAHTGSSRSLREGATAHYVPYTLGLSIPVAGGTGGATSSPIVATASTDWGSLDLTGFSNPTTSGNSASITGSTATATLPDTFTISARFAIPAVASAPASTTAYTDSVTIGVEF